MTTDDQPDAVRECVTRARLEGRDVLRSLLRDGHVTPADIEGYHFARSVQETIEEL